MLLAAPLLAQTADGDLDPSFGVGGKVQHDFGQSTDIAHAVAAQPDGKLVVVGTTYTNNDYSKEDFAVLRLLADGSPDPSFGIAGRVKTDFPGLAAVASSVVVQPDGKILVAGGAFPLFTFLGDFKLVRYNADGSLDASFGTGGIVTTVFPGQGSYAFALALQPDGRIVAAGTDFVNFSSSSSSNTDFALARYHPDGTPDATFGINGQLATDFDGFNDDAFAVLVQPDGKLVAVGSAVSTANFYDFAAARYLQNGALDSSFGTGGKVRTDFGTGGFDQARSAALQTDGKVVAAGFTNFNFGLSQPFALVRYDASGALDATFDGDGKAEIDFGSFNQTAYKVLLPPGGKIVTVGYPNTESSDSDFLVARSHPDGSLDTSFGIGGKVRTSFGDLNGGAQGAALLPDGRIVAAGFNATPTHEFSQFAVARYIGFGIVPVPGCFANPAALAALSSKAVLGVTFDLSLSSSQIATGLAVLHLGFDGTDAAGCGLFAPGLGELLLSLAPAPPQVGLGSLSSGSIAFAVPVPPQTALLGMQVALQGAVAGVSDPGLPVELSNALLVTITQ